MKNCVKWVRNSDERKMVKLVIKNLRIEVENLI